MLQQSCSCTAITVLFFHKTFSKSSYFSHRFCVVPVVLQMHLLSYGPCQNHHLLAAVNETCHWVRLRMRGISTGVGEGRTSMEMQNTQVYVQLTVYGYTVPLSLSLIQ